MEMLFILILNNIDIDQNKPMRIDFDIKFCSIVAPSCSTTIGANVRWIQTGLTVAGGLGAGNEMNQLYNPSSVFVDDDQTVYVADYSNHRIVEWKNGTTSGHVITGRDGSRNRNDQFNYPTDVIFDKESDSLLISDQNNRRVMRWPRRNITSGETIISNIDCWGLAMDISISLIASNMK